MNNQACIFSPVRRKRLETQGVTGFSDQELKDFAFGLRFAYGVCLSIVLVGLLLQNSTILWVAAVIAFFGMFPPYHPIDYIYNYSVRHLLGKPKTPPRANQGRFACIMATAMLLAIIYLMSIGNLLAAYIIGGILVGTAMLVTFLDFCIPSLIYNFIFSSKNK
jgi:hypothetical protein